MTSSRPPRIGIGGPVGSGKTMLCLKLCQRLRERYSMAVVTRSPNQAAAQAFVKNVLGKAGQATLARYGFLALPKPVKASTLNGWQN